MPMPDSLRQKICGHGLVISENALSAFLATNEWELADLAELGLELVQQGQFDLALKVFAKWTELTPDNPEPWTNLGLCFARQRKFQEARDILEYALEINPSYLPAMNNLGEVYQELGEHDLQLKNCLLAVKKNPGSALAFNNLGAAFVDMGMFEEAKHAFETSLLLNSSSFEAGFNLAKLASRAGDNYAAVQYLENAKKNIDGMTSRQADLLDLQLGIEYLICGRLKEGWNLYEKGFSSDIPVSLARGPKREFKVPSWAGQDLSPFEKLMIWREQGVGDEIRFAALIPLLEPSVRKKLILECDKRLVNLFRMSLPEIHVRSEQASVDDFTYHLPIGSLPRFLMHSAEVLRNSKQLLHPELEKIQKFSARLAEFRGKKLIGICWRSHVMSAKRNKKYTALEDWHQILSLPDAVFVNLQYGDCEDEIVDAERQLDIRIIRWDDVDLKNDFDSIAALMTQLHLVISVSSAVVPLAGAVGVKTICMTYQNWVLLGQKDCYPWFPSVLPITVPHSAAMASALPLVYQQLVNSPSN